MRLTRATMVLWIALGASLASSSTVLLARQADTSEPTAGSKPSVFVEAEIEPRDPFVGQQTLYTVWLYTRHRVSQVRPVALPTFAGTWVREVLTPGGTASKTEERGGVPYWRAAVLRRAFFPLRAGPLTLEPTRFDLVVEVPQRTGLDRLFQRPYSLSAASSTLSLNARPLPAVPAGMRGFDGAVGSLTVDTTLEPARVVPGEAALFTVTVRSTGNLFTLQPPRVAWPEGVEVVAPEEEISEEIEQGRLVAARSWRFAVIAQEEGGWELPAVEWIYFDPATEGYRRTASEPRTLTAAMLGNLHGDGHESPGASRASSAHQLELRLAWIAGGALLLFVLLVLAVGLWWRTSKGRNPDPALMAALEGAAQEARPERIARAVEHGWAEYLNRRWRIGLLAADRWNAALAARGAHERLRQDLGRLAEDLALLSGAPRLADLDSLAHEVLLRARRTARRWARP